MISTPKDIYGSLVLHSFCVEVCHSYEIFQYFVNIYPEACLTADCNGKLPIHELLLFRYSNLNGDFETLSWKSTEWKIIVYFLKNYPECFNVSDFSHPRGRTAYQLICDNCGLRECLQRLVLNAIPSLDTDQCKNLNYVHRRQGFFLLVDKKAPYINSRLCFDCRRYIVSFL